MSWISISFEVFASFTFIWVGRYRILLSLTAEPSPLLCPERIFQHFAVALQIGPTQHVHRDAHLETPFSFLDAAKIISKGALCFQLFWHLIDLPSASVESLVLFELFPVFSAAGNEPFCLGHHVAPFKSSLWTSQLPYWRASLSSSIQSFTVPRFAHSLFSLYF